MSYASALLNGVSSEPSSQPKAQAPSQPKQTQPNPQSQSPQSKSAQAQPKEEVSKPVVSQSHPEVVVKPVGNEGGDFGKLVKHEREGLKTLITLKAEHVKSEPKTIAFFAPSVERILDRILNYLQPAELSALGRTCQTFWAKILTNKTYLSRFYPGQKFSKPIITFLLEFAEGKPKEPDTEPVAKTVPLTFFADQRRQNSLCKYWQRLVTRAQEARDKSGIDPSNPLHVKLHGGFSIRGNKHGPLLTERDLTRTLSWLEACIRLLQGKNRQEVPYLDGGKVLFTRYGLGGTKLKVEVVHPPNFAKTEEEKKQLELLPSVRRYDFAEYCMALRVQAKSFVPLVGSCAVTLKNGARNVLPEENDAYLEREKVLNGLLKHQSLHTAVKAIKRLLTGGAIPGSELPAVFRKLREDKLRLKQQQAVEYDNILKFLKNNVPDDFEEAKRQAVKLNDEADKKRVREQDERKKAYENRFKLPQDQNKVKKKVVKEKSADGFTKDTVYIVQDDGKLEEKVFSKPEEVAVTKKAVSEQPSLKSENP